MKRKNRIELPRGETANERAKRLAPEPMKFNFTPGPWHVHGNIGRKGEIGVIADAAPCIIAVMSNQKAWPVEAEANAALIAAAPELYAALEDLVTRCDGEEGVRADGSNIQTMRAHAVLAKVQS